MLFVGIGMSPGVCAYRAMMCLYQRAASCFYYRQSSIRSSVTGDSYMNPAPRGAMPERDCVQDEGLAVLAGGQERRKTWKAFINMVLIYSKPSPESQTHGAAVSGDK